MKILFALTICGLVSTTIYAANLCPPEEDIYPCTCNGTFFAIIYCRNFTTVEELKTVVDETKNIRNFYLYLVNCHISDVPNDIFKGTKLNTLEVEDSEITASGTPGETYLIGVENSLKYLIIINSHKEKLGPMPSPNLDHLNKLRSLILQNNYIPKVGNDWFENGPISLENLVFHGNDIQEIGDKAFATLENLRDFTINFNKQLFLSRSMLPKPAKSIKRLTLSQNNLESLPDDLFSDMPALSEIYLYDNKFTTISEATWSSVWRQLDYIDLTYNPIVCDSKIKWIHEIKGFYKVTGECDEPENLRGRTLQMLISSDFE